MAGLGGMVAELAFAPGKQSGKYRPHIRKVLGLDMNSDDFSSLMVPCADKIDGSRVHHRMPVLDPHTAIGREVIADPSLHVKLAADVAANRMPPLYMDHPVAIESGYKALALFLYVDGVPTTAKDAVIGFWLYIVNSTKKHLCCVVRKKRVCRCGCKGWCTYFAVFLWLHWSLTAMRHGVNPAVDCTGTPLTDPVLAALIGEPLRFIGALIGIKGDWAEFCYTFGFSNWKTLLSPCLFCFATVANMYDDQMLTTDNDVWKPFLSNDYEANCKRHEIHITVDKGLFELIKASLFYDRRKEGAKGRALRWPVRGTVLHAGDRLEPSEEVPDVMDVDRCTRFPLKLVFWRGFKGSKIKHRNPLFDSTLGITPATMLIDVLHAINMGALKHFSNDLFWRLLLSGVWCRIDGGRQEEYIATGVSRMRSCLALWQDKHERGNPDHKATRIQDITVPMIGTPAKRDLKLKAAETKYFFYYLCDEIAANVDAVPQGGIWLDACTNLAKLYRRMDELPWNLSKAESEDTGVALG